MISVFQLTCDAFTFSTQLKEEQSVDGSEEEADDPPDADSDADLSDDDGKKHIDEEVIMQIL